MKKLILFILLALPFLGMAQIQGDSIYVSGKNTFKLGQVIKLGLGTMPNGDFKYTMDGGLSASGSKLPSQYATQSITIDKFVYNKKDAAKGKPINVWAQFKVGSFKYFIQIEPALLSKELLTD